MVVLKSQKKKYIYFQCIAHLFGVTIVNKQNKYTASIFAYPYLSFSVIVSIHSKKVSHFFGIQLYVRGSKTRTNSDLKKFMFLFLNKHSNFYCLSKRIRWLRFLKKNTKTIIIQFRPHLDLF